jgi:hypothetical protein
VNCPYCLSEVSEEAYVCKVCTKDIYLFKPMMARIAELESNTSNSSVNTEYFENRIQTLEHRIAEYEHQRHVNRSFFALIADLFIYILFPLLILLASHYLITIIFDTKMVYLRIISMLVPLPFGFFLFKSLRRHFFPWMLSVFILAIAAVLGMSWLTSLVDHSPILPQSIFEWREMLEYAASISFSFITGIVLGQISYASQHQIKSANENSFINFVMRIFIKDNLSPEKLHEKMKKMNEYFGTILALGTTALSIYTGLKHVL